MSQKVRFWASFVDVECRVHLRGMGLAGRDVLSVRTFEAELLLTLSVSLALHRKSQNIWLSFNMSSFKVNDLRYITLVYK